MTDLIRIHTTAPSEDEANAIAQELLERRLVACVQVDGPVRSHYRWDGQLEHSQEWTCTAKTTAAAFDAVVKCIQQLHSYDTPQIVATALVDASDDYAVWISQSVEQIADHESPARPS